MNFINEISHEYLEENEENQDQIGISSPVKLSFPPPPFTHSTILNQNNRKLCHFNYSFSI